jgi:F0F1-type ATP synthase assembly protein I
MAKASDQNPTGDKNIEAELRVGWKMAGIGMQVASEVAAGALLGFLFDLWRGSGRIGIMVGSITGIAVGLWSLVSQSLKLNRQLELSAPTKGRGKPLPPEPERDRWDDRDEDED